MKEKTEPASVVFSPVARDYPSRGSVGFFGSGRLASRPARLITQSTSGRLILLCQPFRNVWSSRAPGTPAEPYRTMFFKPCKRAETRRAALRTRYEHFLGLRRGVADGYKSPRHCWAEHLPCNFLPPRSNPTLTHPSGESHAPTTRKLNEAFTLCSACDGAAARQKPPGHFWFLELPS
jgi:hypothetical protein